MCQKEQAAKHLVIQDRFARSKTYQMEKEMTRTDQARKQQKGYGKSIFMRNQLTEQDLQVCMESSEVVRWRPGQPTLDAATNQTFCQSASKISRERMGSDVIGLDNTIALPLSSIPCSLRFKSLLLVLTSLWATRRRNSI